MKNREKSNPDLLVFVRDANCLGLNDRSKEVKTWIQRTLRRHERENKFTIAIPDPHIERWLLLDSQAFKHVLGRGCKAPKYKCEKDHYKKLLVEAINSADETSILGGIEFAEDVVKAMNIQRMMRADDSFRRFVEDIRKVFQQWKISD